VTRNYFNPISLKTFAKVLRKFRSIHYMLHRAMGWLNRIADGFILLEKSGNQPSSAFLINRGSNRGVPK